jgi:hypothetical protein
MAESSGRTIVANRAVRAAAVMAAVLVGPPRVHAQARLDSRVFPSVESRPLAFVQEPVRVAPGIAMLASAALPGAGQFLLDRDRWVPYLALELWAWLSFVNRRGDAHALASDYRDLAWTAARRVSVGNRIDPSFPYYESMSHFEASGLLDTDPRIAGVQPEVDTRTYNGDQWALARSLYFPGGIDYPAGSPEYERALQYYLDHGIGPAFTWAWGDRVLEQQTFRELIRRSDEAYRTTTQLLGLILVNHMVSAIDALVLGRTERIGAAGLRLESRMEHDLYGPRLVIGARIPW